MTLRHLRSVASLAALSMALLLQAGCGAGPWGTCRNDPCPKAGEVRQHFCDCGPDYSKDKGGGAGGPVVWITKGSLQEDSAGCPCIGDDAMFVTNPMNRTVRATIRESVYSFQGRYDREATHTKTVGPRDRQFVGCSKSQEPGENISCSLNHSFVPVAVQYVSFIGAPNPGRPLVRANAELASAQANVNNLDCVSECLGPGGPTGLCAMPSFSAAPKETDVVAGVSGLRALVVQRQPYTIAKTSLMHLFSVGADPCNRGDTIVQNGEVVNSGHACTLGSSLNLLGKTLGLAVELPATVKGTVRQNGPEVRFDFADAELAPFLAIGNVGLHENWGGAISQIYTSSSAMVLTTYRGCIAVRLRP